MSRKGENIYKRKDGRWEGRYKNGVADNGHTRYSSCYGKTYREVKAKLEFCKQAQVTRENRKNSSEKLFGDYCGEWLLFSKTRVKESTIAKYTAAVENHIKPFFGRYKPEQITTELTADFADHIIQHKKLSVNTAKELTVILKTILKYIVKNRGGMELIDVASPKVVPKEIRVLSQEEQQKMIDYLQEDMNSNKFAILFALMTGLRIGEVCALRFKDISLTNKLVTVRETVQRVKNLDGIGAKTKLIFTAPKSNTSARFVPLTNAAFEMCKDMIDESKPNAFLLTGSEIKFTEPRVLQYYIKKYSAACGIEKEDFELDKIIILKMAQSPDENDHHLIWMCRPLGTHCFAERDVFLENTFENRGLYAYHSEKPNKNLLYALHLKRNDGETVKGDIYTLDYAKEVERVSLLSCPVTQVTLYFADGKEITVPYESFHDAIHELTPKHGAIDSFRYRPESEAELGLILRRLHFKRDRQANVGDFEQHIESLQKSSVRNKLQRAKSEVKPSESKPPKKKEPSL